MRRLTLLIFAFTLTACHTGINSYYTQSVQSWRGGNVRDLQAVWGKPFEYVTTPSGHKLYVYKRQDVSNHRANYSPQIGITSPDRPVTVITAMPDANTPWESGLNAYCIISFTANAKGTIISTDIQGTNCQVSQSKALQLANPKG